MTNIKLDGSFCLTTIGLKLNELLKSYHEHEQITLDCSDVTQWDLTGLQLLISVLSSSNVSQKCIVVSGVTDSLSRSLERAGLSVSPNRNQICVKRT